VKTKWKIEIISTKKLYGMVIEIDTKCRWSETPKQFILNLMVNFDGKV
jgi:hypothetical protein